MHLRTTTRNEIRRFQRAKILSRIGEEYRGDDVVRVETFKHANKLLADERWSYEYLVFLDNRISTDVIKNAGYRYYSDTWNVIAKEILPINDLIKRKISGQMRSLNPKSVRHTIGMIFGSQLMEHEYREHLNSFYTTRVYEIILKGHLPCYWEGDFYDGKPYVF